MHWLPKQQPAQFAGPHEGCTHWLLAHTRPEDAHCWHALPPAPQAFGSLPAKQMSRSQHPAGQFGGPHGPTRLPQAWRLVSQRSKPSARQFWQAVPTEPQAFSLSPGRQRPLLSQQPVGQVLALQPGGRPSTSASCPPSK
jgi:hypothetical protein